MEKINLTGTTIGGIYISSMATSKPRHISYNCICTCGLGVILSEFILNKIQIEPRGCIHTYKQKRGAAWNRTHNMKDSLEYKTWSMMKNRCSNPNSNRVNSYLNKGITVCDRWLHSFENFYEDMGKRPSKEYSIDRIDNSKGYFKENCKWSTQKEQGNNQDSNVMITFNGETLSIAQWSDKLGIPYKTLHRRIQTSGWPINRAFTEPIGYGRNILYERDGAYRTIKQWAVITGISYGLVMRRVNHCKWDYNKALFTPLKKAQ